MTFGAGRPGELPAASSFSVPQSVRLLFDVSNIPYTWGGLQRYGHPTLKRRMNQMRTRCNLELRQPRRRREPMAPLSHATFRWCGLLMEFVSMLPEGNVQPDRCQDGTRNLGRENGLCETVVPEVGDEDDARMGQIGRWILNTGE